MSTKTDTPLRTPHQAMTREALCEVLEERAYALRNSTHGERGQCALCLSVADAILERFSGSAGQRETQGEPVAWRMKWHDLRTNAIRWELGFRRSDFDGYQPKSLTDAVAVTLDPLYLGAASSVPTAPVPDGFKCVHCGAGGGEAHHSQCVLRGAASSGVSPEPLVRCPRCEQIAPLADMEAHTCKRASGVSPSAPEHWQNSPEVREARRLVDDCTAEWAVAKTEGDEVEANVKLDAALDALCEAVARASGVSPLPTAPTPLVGTMECPICGLAYPHYHDPEWIKLHQHLEHLWRDHQGLLLAYASGESLHVQDREVVMAFFRLMQVRAGDRQAVESGSPLPNPAPSRETDDA